MRRKDLEAVLAAADEDFAAGVSLLRALFQVYPGDPEIARLLALPWNAWIE